MTHDWQAVLVESGDAFGWDDFDGNFAEGALDDVRIEIVRGTAAPDETGRMPGQYLATDLLLELADFETFEQVEERWAQAQAMVAGLNRRIYPALTTDDKPECQRLLDEMPPGELTRLALQSWELYDLARRTLRAKTGRYLAITDATDESDGVA